MTSCESWRQTRWLTNLLAKRYSPPRWCMRPGCGWSEAVNSIGTAGGHFFAAAAEAMRRILIEVIRRKQSQQRGGNWQRIELDESTLVLERPASEMLDIDAALEKLAREDASAADLVKLRYFVGFTLPEAAEALNISARTADRLWAYARSWLRQELKQDKSG